MATRESMLGTLAAETFIVGRVSGTLNETPEDELLVAGLADGVTQGRIHRVPYPDDWPLPTLAFSRYGGVPDIGPIGSPVTVQSLTYQVRAICEGYDQGPIEDPAIMMNELLDARSSMVEVATTFGSGTFYVECTRQSELTLDLPAEEDGSVYQHLGGIYNLFVQRIG